jgi:DNA helicase II / ATP-dependent DNA helicase PcrA
MENKQYLWYSSARMFDISRELNEEQSKVVLSGDGYCLVLAGAGSGKTRTITYRVAHLLEQGVAPEQILLVTFTNKAAREMTERIGLVTGRDKALPWAGTFHHICYRLLRQYAPLIGYKNNFTILDSEDSNDMMKLCVKQEGIDRTEKRFPSPQVISSIVSYARNAQTTIHDVLESQHERFLDVEETIVRIAEDYRIRKQQANAMDFDDLLINTFLLLQKEPSVREKLADQFKYVLVDEYQDTNKIQSDIVSQLSSVHHNLLVVGDDAQSIYSFRAARIENILDFEKIHANAKVFRLEVNYRSTPEILDLANNSIAHNTEQYKKELRSIQRSHARPELHAFVDEVAEGNFIAKRILELREEGVELQEIAVLFRAAFHSRALEVELAKRNIPYEYRGGVRFFERAHIKDVLAYLRVMQNHLDVVAWSRVLTMQVGIGPAAAQGIIRAVQQGVEVSEIGGSLGARAQVGWSDFIKIYSALVQCDRTDVSLCIQTILTSGYDAYLEREFPDYRERKDDIEQLAVYAQRDKDLDAFLANAAMQEGFGKAQQHQADDNDEKKMVLSTIHQAKGLEWKAVFVINLTNGSFPSDRSMREPKGLEEERRLFYVAITRAKQYLHLTYPLSGGGFGGFMQGPSIFLEELDSSLLSGDSDTVFVSHDDPEEIIYVSEDEEGGRPPKRSGAVREFLKSLDDL